MDLPYGMYLKVATVEDTSRVYGVLHEALESHPNYPNTWKTFADIQEHMEVFIGDRNNLVLLLCNAEDHRILGVLVAAKISSPFLFQPWATELLWWVSPDGRKGRNPLRMIEALEYWARQEDCSYVKLAMTERLSRRQTKRLNRIYRKKGFHPFERSYIKELT